MLLFDLENDPYEMNNLVDDLDMAEDIARHHRLMRDRLVETGDVYVLRPAFGCEGLNEWDIPLQDEGKVQR